MRPTHWRAGVRAIHFWVSLLLGLQVLAWTGSGLFFTLYPIDTVRGRHLRADPAPSALDWRNIGVAPEIAAASAGGAPAEIRLRTLLGAPVYEIETLEGDRALVDAKSGQRLPPISASQAERLAIEALKSPGAHLAPQWLAQAPHEAGTKGAVWRVDFPDQDGARVYIDPTTGQVLRVRTHLWRTYDALWGLHIMDWRGKENFHTIWLAGFAFGGLVLSVSGFAMGLDGLARRARRRGAFQPWSRKGGNDA